MPHPLDPLITPKLSLHNRLVMPPMATARADEDGDMTSALLDYYDEKSRGGALGLVITEHCYIALQGRNRIGQPSIADNSTVEGWRQLVEIVHRNGSKVVMQINHAGGATSRAATRVQTVGPSAITSLIGPGEVPRQLGRDEIAVIADQFAAAASRVKAAGFDGVEIHSAHGYLLDQFYSPLTNHRTDEYGGDVSNRIRAHLDVIEAVRSAVGDDFCVMLRLGASDYMPGGATLEDSLIAAVEFERAGIDMLDISGGLNGYVRPEHDEPGYFRELTEAIQHVVSIPLILTGGVTEPVHAEALLAEGAADLIGVGRAILKDSGWAPRAVSEWVNTSQNVAGSSATE